MDSIQCEAHTQKGERCKRNAAGGGVLCNQRNRNGTRNISQPGENVPDINREKGYSEEICELLVQEKYDDLPLNSETIESLWGTPFHPINQQPTCGSLCTELRIYESRLVEISTICGNCLRKNNNTITHAISSSWSDSEIMINCELLGTRRCDSQNCNGDYSVNNFFEYRKVTKMNLNLKDFTLKIYHADGTSILGMFGKNPLIAKFKFRNSKEREYTLKVEEYIDNGFVHRGYINMKFSSKKEAREHYDNNISDGLRKINAHATDISDWHPISRLRCSVVDAANVAVGESFTMSQVFPN